MRFIFFDLETSDKNFIGQILNYAFVATDQFLEPRAELRGLIQVSRLQLPSPESILVNRVNLLEHQKQAAHSEPQAMREIQKFIQSEINAAESDSEQAGVCLVGYNSSRFDVPFLRTSLIRNGINPYFSGKLRYKDMLHVVRKAYLSCPDFPAPRSNQDAQLLSLSLENVARELSLLEQAQSHDSYQDVLLTIALAKCLETNFKIKLADFEAYEARICEQNKFRENIWMQNLINYELAIPGRAIAVPVALHAFNYKEALWIDLQKFEQNNKEKSLFWINKNSAAFYLGACEESGSKWEDLAKKARKEFREISLENYFKPSTCDIEQDIYRVDFDGITALEQAIWHGNTAALKQLPARDAKVLFKRFQLNNYRWGGTHDERMQKSLKAYADYRYFGEIKLKKFENEAGSSAEQQTPNLMQMLEEVVKLQQDADSEDKRLLAALHAYYLSSDIYKLYSDRLAAN